MIPILFDAKATDFSTNGIGRLSDCASCLVTEARNGIYELEMTYPVTGAFYQEIRMASLILAVPGDGQQAQPFAVYKISKPLQGVVRIYAQHMSYQLSCIPCAPFTASGVSEALGGLKQYAAEPCPYTFWTDKTTAGAFSVPVPASIRSRLGGVSGSILDVYGGEYEFDRFTVKLHANRGADRGVVLRYGKNLTDLRQEENIANTITGVYPYWADSEGHLVQLPEKVLTSEHAQNFPYPRTVPLDLSSEFEQAPTEAELRAKAQAYMEQNDIGIPAVSVSVSFVALWQTEEYKDIAPLERVKLCDTVTVSYEKLGVDVKAKVVKTVYNVLEDKYSSLEIGEIRSNLAGTIAAQNRELAEQQKEIWEKPSKGFLDAAVKNATNWITGANGGYVILHKDGNNVPYEILVMDTDSLETAQHVWRWNKNGWGYSENGYQGPYKLAATIDGGFVADFITTGTMLANRIKGGTLELGGPGNGNGVCVLYDASGKEITRMDTNGIKSIQGSIGGWTINERALYKTINIYPDMSAAGLAGVADDAPVQYWAWVWMPENTNTNVFSIASKSKADYLSGKNTIKIIFSVTADGTVTANTLNSTNANITGGMIDIETGYQQSKIKLNGTNGTDKYSISMMPSMLKFLWEGKNNIETYIGAGEISGKSSGVPGGGFSIDPVEADFYNVNVRGTLKVNGKIIA